MNVKGGADLYTESDRSFSRIASYSDRRMYKWWVNSAAVWGGALKHGKGERTDAVPISQLQGVNYR